MKRTFKTKSAEELEAIAKQFASELTPGSVLALFGDLGAGKTTFVQGLVQTIDGIDPAMVSSPTFSLMHTYPGNIPVHHFDLYRLKNSDEFFQAGFDEYLEADGICCIEWAEKIEGHLPENCWKITLSHAGGTERMIEITHEETALY